MSDLTLGIIIGAGGMLTLVVVVLVTAVWWHDRADPNFPDSIDL